MDESQTGTRTERVERERAEQARWRLRATGGRLDWFDALIDAEFLPPEQHFANEAQRLLKILTFAGSHVPYYREVFAQLGLSAADITSARQLPLLPELSKRIIRQHTDRLRPLALPAGQKRAGSHTSSGSTGKPIRIPETDYAWFMRMLITQRQLRWYRFDPMASVASVRVASNLPRVGGERLKSGQTVARDAWPGLGKFFLTGSFSGFSLDNSLDQIVCWLEQHHPAYLHSSCGLLEHLAFAFQERDKLDGLLGIRAVSEPLPAGQRARIETTLAAPVHISYGMDETGWLATRCSEGGRYHVHTEHCLIEIVDNEGQHCKPGDYGRVLVTILSNAAMPLIRYDTDDVAQAVVGPCACGRTLPAFGDIVGRQSQMSDLPGGTLNVVASLRAAMDTLPREFSLAVREYQLRQTLDGNFQLCLVLVGERHPGFNGYLERAFNSALEEADAGAQSQADLKILEVLQIPRSPSGKFLHFVSDFTQSQLEKDRFEGPAVTS